MGKNKPARNAFFYFMLEFKEKNPRRFENMQVVAEAAGPHWQKLSAEQKKPYEEKAKFDKNNQKVAKYTSTGLKIDVVQRRENERIAKEQQIKDDIENTVRSASASGHIANEMFYLIHINQFCYCNTKKEYIPAELAVARFSLQDGVTPDNVFHIIVKPGPLPMGYSYLAKKTSDETHQIEPPLGDDAEDNLTQVANGLMRFVADEQSSKMGYPAFYAQAKNKDIAESVLRSLCAEVGHREDLFKVYPMEYLFYVLRNAVTEGPTPVYPVLSMSTLELEKDKYDFCKDIPCSYHELSDVPNHCSRSHVVRLAYIICDNCCDDLGIELIPGQHIPREAHIVSSRAPSRASEYASSVASFSTVREAPVRGNPSQYNAKENNYYLSQDTESVMSVSGLTAMSETSSICDSNDYVALGGYTYDSELSQADTEEWIQPKQRHRRNDNKQQLSQSSMNSSKIESASQLFFPSTSSTSNMNNQPKVNNQPTMNRRPVKLSAVLTGDMSQLSVSSSGSIKNVLPVGRGRGRGIAANFMNKMT